MIAAFVTVSPAAFAIARASSNCARPIVEAFETTRKTFLKPRSVSWSANDIVIRGMPRRSVTSEIAMESEEAKAPRIATTWFCEIIRWATLAAVVGVEVPSATIRLILAPSRPAMPPAALISSATSSMPLRELMPNWALAPDSGWMTPTLTDLGCARTMAGKPAATVATPAAATRPRRVESTGRLETDLRPELMSCLQAVDAYHPCVLSYCLIARQDSKCGGNGRCCQIREPENDERPSLAARSRRQRARRARCRPSGGAAAAPPGAGSRRSRRTGRRGYRGRFDSKRTRTSGRMARDAGRAATAGPP